MWFRAVCLWMVVVGMPLQASAAQYVVQAGDTLGRIAQRCHVSLAALARANHISNTNLLQIGRVLWIPEKARVFSYRVHWGDTLLGIAMRNHVSVSVIRSMNPSLGSYLLAGQWLRLCRPCSSGAMPYTRVSPVPTYRTTSSATTTYIIHSGDTLGGIAVHYGVSLSSLMAVNHLGNPNLVVIGTRLVIPRLRALSYLPSLARSLIVVHARRYGLHPSLPLAVGWQESGFNQHVVSRTGAIGVMQVEPYTAARIARIWGRSVNLYNLDDNIRAGVFWLAVLTRYYGGNERLAIAAYYQGTSALDRYGMYTDTVRYVSNVLALKSNFGG